MLTCLHVKLIYHHTIHDLEFALPKVRIQILGYDFAIHGRRPWRA